MTEIADLNTLDTVAAATEGAFMQLTHPKTDLPLTDSEGKPMGITFFGQDGPEARKYMRNAQDRRLKAANGRRAGTPITAVELEEESIGLILACANGWYIRLGGEAPPFSKEACLAFLKKFPHWREQSDKFIGDRANFLKDTPTA